MKLEGEILNAYLFIFPLIFHCAIGKSKPQSIYLPLAPLLGYIYPLSGLTMEETIYSPISLFIFFSFVRF